MQRSNSDQGSAPFLRVHESDGGFPHVRRRSVRLACCCCSTCCFTFLLGGVGGIAGIVTGVVKAVSAAPASTEPRSELTAYALGFVRVILFALGYGIAGILLGAAVGFAIDFLFVFPH